MTRPIDDLADEIASFRCGGKLGEYSFSSPLVRVSILPAEIVLRPNFMSPIRINKSDIQRIEGCRKRFLRSAAIKIVLSSNIISSPVILYTRPDGDLARAIETMTETSITPDE